MDALGLAGVTTVGTERHEPQPTVGAPPRQSATFGCRRPQSGRMRERDRRRPPARGVPRRGCGPPEPRCQHHIEPPGGCHVDQRSPAHDDHARSGHDHDQQARGDHHHPGARHSTAARAGEGDRRRGLGDGGRTALPRARHPWRLHQRRGLPPVVKGRADPRLALGPSRAESDRRRRARPKRPDQGRGLPGDDGAPSG